jgi:hypothetical protein
MEIIVWLIVMAVVCVVVMMAAPYHNRMINSRPDITREFAPKTDAR